MDTWAIGMFDAPCRLVLAAFKFCAKPYENVLSFLCRDSTENSVFRFTQRAESIKVSLKETHTQCETIWKELITEINTLFDTFLESLNLHPKEKLDIDKILRVIASVQPCVVVSDPYITRFMYPNIDEVLQAENLQI